MTQFIRISDTRVVNSARILDITIAKSTFSKDRSEVHGPGGDYSIFVNLEPLVGARLPATLTLVDGLTEELAILTLSGIEAHLNGPLKDLSLTTFLRAMDFKDNDAKMLAASA